jgi:hypothetical protein
MGEFAASAKDQWTLFDKATVCGAENRSLDAFIYSVPFL